MATYRDNAANMPSVADTTSFRNWIIDVVEMLEGSGWAQAADTGQLDETTVTYPAAVSTVAGSQIWYLDDSLHSTYPLYMRLTFGRGSSGYRISLTVQFGYATNGTGSLSGWTSSVITIALGSNSADAPVAATGQNIASGGEGYAWFINGKHGWAGTSRNIFISVSREFNTDGTVANNGNWCVEYLGTSSYQTLVQSVNRQAALVFSGNINCVPPFDTVLSGSATETELWRHLVKLPHVSAIGSAFTYFIGDIQEGAPFSADVNGAVRTYLPTGLDLASNSASNRGSHMHALLWE